MDFNDAKLRQLDAAATYRVYGHEVEFEQGASARRRWRLIWPCFCVHDSPENPCPCMEDGPIWWLQGDAVLNEGDAGRKGHEGEELHFFDVRLDSQIMVESVQPVRASDLKRLEGAVSPERFRDLMTGTGSGGAEVVFAKPGPSTFWGKVIEIALEVAKELGAFEAIDWQGAAEKWKESQKGKERPQ